MSGFPSRGSRRGGESSRGQNFSKRGGTYSRTPNDNNEKYTLIISNVENSFAAVHAAAIENYACLNPCLNKGGPHFQEHEISKEENEARDKEVDSNAADEVSDGEHIGDSKTHTQKKNNVNSKCHYEISCRTETRTAEIEVFGKSHSDISLIFKHHENRLHPAPISGEAGVKEERTSKLNDLLDLAAYSQRRPYFLYPPRVFVNLPDRPFGPIEVECAAEHAQRGRKREREEGKDGFGKGHDNEPTSKQGGDPTVVTNASFSQKNLVTTTFTISLPSSTSTNNTSFRGNGGGSDSHHSTWTMRTVKEGLKYIPGYCNCWRVSGPRTFRVVFLDKEHLFKAKQLLDQFPLSEERGERAVLSIPDNLQQEYTAFMETVEGAASPA